MLGTLVFARGPGGSRRTTVFGPDFEPFTGGIAGSLLGYVPGSIFSPVHFGDGSGLRAIDLLNQIALQLRESGWLIIAQPDGSALQYGFITPQGWTTNGTVKLP